MIRIGLIGAGGNGRGNIKKLAEHSGRCRIVAVADLNADLARQAAEPYGARTYEKFQDFFDEVDAVIISSPNFLHPEHAIACAQAGKHVWIEKPMALNTADADRIVAAVKKAGVVSFVGFSVRFDPTVRAMKERFARGELGDLLSIWARRLAYSAPVQAGRSWRTDYSKSGGVMSELLVHELDWIVDIAGMPTSLYCRKASRRHACPEENDHIWITLGFGAEATGTIEGSDMSPIADYYRGVVGMKGSLHTRAWGGELYLQPGPDAAKTEKVNLPPGFDKHGHFLDAVEGRVPSVADAAWGRKIVTLSEKAIASAVSGQALAV